MLMEVAGDAFEVVGDGAFGEVRLGKSQVGRHIEIDLSHLFGIEHPHVLTPFLIGLPFLAVESDKG